MPGTFDKWMDELGLKVAITSGADPSEGPITVVGARNSTGSSQLLDYLADRVGDDIVRDQAFESISVLPIGYPGSRLGGPVWQPTAKGGK